MRKHLLALHIAATLWVLALILASIPASAQQPVTLWTCVSNPTTGQQACSPGGTPTHVLSTASTNSTNIKGAPGFLFTVVGFNTNAATAFLKFYDKATAPTCNTDTVVATYPLVQNIPLLVNSAMAKNFVNGIGLCITGGIADNDNTNATTGIAVSLDFR